MNWNGIKIAVAATIAAASVCMPVAAQDRKSAGDTDHWQMPYQSEFWRYASLSFGRSAYDFDCRHDTDLPCDEMDKSAFKIAASGKFNRTLGIEIAYVNLGDVSLPTLRGHTRAQGVNFSIVAAATVFERIGAHTRIGGVYGWTRSRLRAANMSCLLPGPPETDYLCNLSQSDRGFGMSYGVGLSARIAPRVELRMDWDRYRFPFAQQGGFDRVGGKRDVDLSSVGLNLLF